MPFLNKAVSLINDTIIEALCFTTPGKIQAFGIVETIVRNVGDEEQMLVQRFPAYIDDDGEGHEVIPDDLFDVTLYHRIDSLTNATQKAAFGDGQGDILETANMTLTVFAYRTKIRKPVQDIEALIKDRFPDAAIYIKDAAGKELQKSVLRLGNSTFDRIAIEQKEFTNVSLDYPKLTAFQLSYKIESTWRKGCLEVC